jgi:hypothetical protein
MLISQTKTDYLAVDFARFYIPTMLYEGRQHVYSILSIFKERTRKEINHSIVYPFLHQQKRRYTSSPSPQASPVIALTNFDASSLVLNGP